MKRLEFFKELYHHEHERRSRLTGWLTIPVGVATVLAGAMTYLIERYPFDAPVLRWLFAAPMVAAISFLVLVIYELFRSYFNFDYRHAPYPDKLHKHLMGLSEYYRSTEPNSWAKAAGSDFATFLAERYAKAAGENARNNDQKSLRLHRANQRLLALTVSVLLSAPIYFVTPCPSSLPEGLVVMTPGQQGSSDSKNDPPPPKNDPPPSKPDPPPDRILKEGDSKTVEK